MIDAKRLVALRKRTGLTQEGFAKVVGVDRITVWRWENGHKPIDRFKASHIKAVTDRLLNKQGE
jgi:transcriptional regulator with XRE-family HTH domain